MYRYLPKYTPRPMCKKRSKNRRLAPLACEYRKHHPKSLSREIASTTPKAMDASLLYRILRIRPVAIWIPTVIPKRLPPFQNTLILGGQGSLRALPTPAHRGTKHYTLQRSTTPAGSRSYTSIKRCSCRGVFSIYEDIPGGTHLGFP